MRNAKKKNDEANVRISSSTAVKQVFANGSKVNSACAAQLFGAKRPHFDLGKSRISICNRNEIVIEFML